jgi:hypothetical protein
MDDLIIDLAKTGSEDGARSPIETEASILLPESTVNEASAILPTPTVKEASISPPTQIEAGMTPKKPTIPKLKGTPNPDWPATPSSENNCSSNDTEDEEYIRCFLEWLIHNPNCKKRFDNERQILAHHLTKIRNKAKPIFQQEVNKNSRLIMQSQTQIAVAIHAIHEPIV